MIPDGWHVGLYWWCELCNTFRFWKRHTLVAWCTVDWLNSTLLRVVVTQCRMLLATKGSYRSFAHDWSGPHACLSTTYINHLIRMFASSWHLMGVSYVACIGCLHSWRDHERRSYRQEEGHERMLLIIEGQFQVDEPSDKLLGVKRGFEGLDDSDTAIMWPEEVGYFWRKKASSIASLERGMAIVVDTVPLWTHMIDHDQKWSLQSQKWSPRH